MYEPWDLTPKYIKTDYGFMYSDDEQPAKESKPQPEPEPLPQVKKTRLRAIHEMQRKEQLEEATRKAEADRKQRAEEKLQRISELIDKRMATEKDLEERYQEKEELMQIEKNEVDAILQQLIDDAMKEGRMPSGITADEVYAVLKEHRDERRKERKEAAKQKKKQTLPVRDNEAPHTPTRPTQTQTAATEPHRPAAVPIETPRRWGFGGIPSSIGKAFSSLRRPALPFTSKATEDTHVAQQEAQTAQPQKSSRPQSAAMKQGKMTASKFYQPTGLRGDFAENIMGQFEEHVSSLVDKRVKEELERNEAAGQVKLFVEQRVKEELAKIEEENSRKRKRGEPSPSAIPNPAGESFGLNSDFFEYSSEGSPGTTPTKEMHDVPLMPETIGAKRKRLANGAAQVTKAVNTETQREQVFAPKTPRKRTKEEWDAMDMYQEANVRRRIMGRETVGEEMIRREKEQEAKEKEAKEKVAHGADVAKVTGTYHAKAGDVDDEWVYLFKPQPADRTAVNQTNYDGELPRIRRRQNVFKINGQYYQSRGDYYKSLPENTNVREGILKGGAKKGQDLVVDMKHFVVHPAKGDRVHPQSKVLLDWVPVETEGKPPGPEPPAEKTPAPSRQPLVRKAADEAAQRRQAAEQQKREQERLAKARKDAQRYTPAKPSRLGSLSTIASVAEPDEDEDVEEEPTVSVPPLDWDDAEEELDPEEERDAEKLANGEGIPDDEAAYPEAATEKSEDPMAYWFAHQLQSMEIPDMWEFTGI